MIGFLVIVPGFFYQFVSRKQQASLLQCDCLDRLSNLAHWELAPEVTELNKFAFKLIISTYSFCSTLRWGWNFLSKWSAMGIFGVWIHIVLFESRIWCAVLDFCCMSRNYSLLLCDIWSVSIMGGSMSQIVQQICLFSWEAQRRCGFTVTNSSWKLITYATWKSNSIIDIAGIPNEECCLDECPSGLRDGRTSSWM